MGEVDHTLHGDTHHRWLVVIIADGADGVERVLENPIPDRNFRLGNRYFPI